MTHGPQARCNMRKQFHDSDDNMHGMTVNGRVPGRA